MQFSELDHLVKINVSLEKPAIIYGTCIVINGVIVDVHMYVRTYGYLNVIHFSMFV